ncbi:PREDICTED: AAA-ATPase At3g50940-like [Nelumbo nucifera]|uniref:AAA-ATPase At3g50940-like n=2 Tax=Nelumbo nucifera TaxID=4432 RepID=A0A1U7Z3E7_NELNU|nr:PREDICTED: AAA-ATPase At3g50940-like [Nelumbo nucifera]DAD17866.1 TPA_asm: hypothetical protein HUJ06_019329 [Nelumbo nucifera]
MASLSSRILNAFSLREMPSMTTLFSGYASLATAFLLIQSLINQFIPHHLRGYLFSSLGYLLRLWSAQFTLVIEEFNGITANEVYEASEMYLRTRISPSVSRLNLSKAPRDKNLILTIENGEEIIDVFEGIQLKWKFICSNDAKGRHDDTQRSFELCFNKKYKEKVLGSYFSHIFDMSNAMKEDSKVVKLHTLGSLHHDRGVGVWGSINLEHPATFDTLAMEPKLKKDLIDDLDRFMKRRNYYKKVGKAWKRGYLLYGPPGTGKSSLIAAMANYLNFHIYDLELSKVRRDSDLRRLLVATKNRSILVIEDIDCSIQLYDRQVQTNRDKPVEVKAKASSNPHLEGKPLEIKLKASDDQVTLSGLLNFIDGLWSSCGDQRIIVLTTNHKDWLDPALLRPGRMDKHIHMSYCTPKGFKLLASNYLGIHENHQLFREIEDLIENIQVTPAEVAEELMKSEEAEVALSGLINFLEQKKTKHNKIKCEERKVGAEKEDSKNLTCKVQQ